ncbi:DUF1800 domain-containing protein [Polaromonas sp. C04]|uniref:DUF1800 domain-containing protein n=1 Tax=Polaromonas sp. C04 TaxID=1945857 RepID=UPI000984E3C5|nr:DUF1800 domain-containing protein [Polaromonas sp. C04]OOG49897.1 hypothetical protein B0E49_19590 [Polaromonas sp. C04]
MAVGRLLPVTTLAALLAGGMLGGCTTPGVAGTPVATTAPAPGPGQPGDVEVFKVINHLTWGANTAAVEQAQGSRLDPYLSRQLHPTPARLPPAVQAQIDAMSISQRPMGELAQEMAQRRKAAVALTNDDDKKAALQAWQQEMNRLGREAATRHILRALYSPNQLQEQMTWFWMNHFSVFQYKGNLRATIGDYEDTAIRPHALGKFRDLLGAVAHHPAMLVYLDNVQNAAGHINENYARELMELHTLGVNAGYTQHDVQELARILTGVGVNYGANEPALRRELQPFYVRQGAFVFNPRRHDFGPKDFLGQPIRSQGLAEFDEALDRLARAPATARFISHKLAVYWLSDDPPPALVARMAQTFAHTDGDIAATLQTLLTSREFAQLAGRKFKDPMRYVISSLRLAYDDKTILNVAPILNWLNRMGEPLYGHQTPDGYPLIESAWASPGQMATRFEIAKAIGSGSAGLFKADEPQPRERPAFPQLANALYFDAIRQTLSPATRHALDQAASPQEWNTFLLSSPEWMNR